MCIRDSSKSVAILKFVAESILAMERSHKGFAASSVADAARATTNAILAAESRGIDPYTLKDGVYSGNDYSDCDLGARVMGACNCSTDALPGGDASKSRWRNYRHIKALIESGRITASSTILQSVFEDDDMPLDDI